MEGRYENAEYHQAREDMAWAQGRVREIQYILDNLDVLQQETVEVSIDLVNVQPYFSDNYCVAINHWRHSWSHIML